MMTAALVAVALSIIVEDVARAQSHHAFLAIVAALQLSLALPVRRTRYLRLLPLKRRTRHV